MDPRPQAIENKTLLKKRDTTVTENLCANCTALCCSDLVMLIDPPKTEEDLDTYKWYLQYHTSFIYILDKQWYHLVNGTCMYLDSKTRLCTIYDRRPQKCRDHHPPECERYGQWYDIFFNDPDELVAYVKKHKLIKPKKASKKPAKKSKKKTNA